MNPSKTNGENTFGIDARTLAACIVAVIVIVSIRLAIAAEATNNWRGFYFSVFHLIVVGAASFLSLRK